MNILVLQEQIDRIIPEEDIEFVKAWYQKKGYFPNYRTLQQSDEKVGATMPTHSKKDIKTRSYVDTYLGKVLNSIVATLAAEKGISFDKQTIGSKRYVSKDAKELLRSELEVLTYNVFLLEGLENEIEVDTKKFLKTCGKIPDFLWEDKKLMIEVAGLEDKDYRKKLEDGKKCLESLGYTVLIIEAREFEKQSKYVNYYKKLCELFGFNVRQDVIEEPYKYLGYTEVDREFKQKYIDENINKLPLIRKTQYYLNKYINQLYGYGIKEYKNRKQLKRFRHSIDKKEIINFKTENPNMSNSEIAKHFGVSKNTIQIATVGMQGRKR